MTTVAPERVAAARAAALRTLSLETAGLQRAYAALAGPLGDAFARALDLLDCAPGRIVVCGMGKSGHVGRKVAATLSSTGSPALFLHPAEASHGDLGMITERDAVLALSWSGETAELRDVIEYSRRFRVPLVALTARADSALGRAADAALVLPEAEEACPNGLAPTTSTTMQLAIGDAIAVALIERRGFTPDAFRVFHPGGKLGSQLLRVSELMLPAEELPLVRPDTPVTEALFTMSGGRLGCAIAVDGEGRLVGIVTDGDLRRLAASKGGLSGAVADAMSPRPHRTAPETLASEALREMNANKVTVLVVTEGDRPVGAVRLHAILERGLA